MLKIKSFVISLSIVSFAYPLAHADVQGIYFSKKEYEPKPLPQFVLLRDQLPKPILPEHQAWVDTYWKAWELAFTHFHEPSPGSGFVSQFIDAAFNANIFLWDTSFMTMFTSLADPLVPGISSLDNFYAKQHQDGEICREIVRSSGQDFSLWVNTENSDLFSRWGWYFLATIPQTAPYDGHVVYKEREVPEQAPQLTLDALNHPILAWAELESFRLTGDRDRLALVWSSLVHYYDALQMYLQQGDGLYVTDWGSMDNSPRNEFLFQNGFAGGTAVDISSEMALFAYDLEIIAHLIGKDNEAKQYHNQYVALAQKINSKMWSETDKFYFDLTPDSEQIKIKTVAAFWPLLAHVASPEQAALLVEQLKNPKTFGRKNLVPTESADAPGFDPHGGYWRGAVWAPTVFMVIRGLENYGYESLAQEIAINHLELVSRVFQKTGTIWENYSSDFDEQGKHPDGSDVAKDFVGWSGLGPIRFLLEYAIGLKPDAQNNAVTWHLSTPLRVGCENYYFRGQKISFLADPQNGAHRKLHVKSKSRLHLKVNWNGRAQVFNILPGENEISLQL